MLALDHLRILATVVVPGLVATLAGCGLIEAPDPEPAVLGPAIVPAPPNPMAGAPPAGSCHQLTPDEISKGIDSRRAVPCDGEHTTVTYLVELFPEDSATDKVNHARKTCAAGLAGAVGVPEAQLDGLMLTWSWLEPNARHRARGADWFRCDVHALPEATAATTSLPGKGLPVINDEAPVHLQRCANAQEKTGRTTFVSCDQTHGYRWSGSVPVEAKSYPDAEDWRARADAGCRPLVGNDAFVFTYPPASEWKQGVRRLSCYREA